MTWFAEGVPCWTDATFADIEAGKRFYAELFDWTFEDTDGPWIWAYRAGKKVAAVTAGTAEAWIRKPVGWCSYFASPDVAATAARIRAAGGKVTGEPRPVGGHGTMLPAQDPAGAFFGIWQAGAHAGFELRDEPGSFCWAEVYTWEKKIVDPFWREVFGFGERQVGAGDTDLVAWSIDGTGVTSRLELDDRFPARLPSHVLTCFSAGNCDEAVDTVLRLGGQVAEEPRDSRFGRYAVVSDDQEVRFAIVDLATKLPKAPA